MSELVYLHPMIVHFPIALLIIGFLSDLAGLVLKRQFFSSAGLFLLILGTISLVAAYLSGNAAGEGLAEEGPLKRALDFHEGAAELTLWIMLFAAIFRLGMLVMKKTTTGWRWIAVGLFFLGVLSVARTGYYGGRLVFNHAAGVQIAIDTEAESSSESGINSSSTNPQ
jgi:uncharacterized membrane protein